MKTLAFSAVALSAVALADSASDLKVINFKNLGLKQRNSDKSIRYVPLQKRAESDQVQLQNVDQNLYAITLGVGSPSQQIAVQLDTGSSDLWFPVTGSRLCQLKTSECSTFGSYSTSSSTAKNLSEPFQIAYGDGTKIFGTFITDNVQVGDTQLKSVQFAACTSGSSDTGVQGIMGIGYDTNEAPVALGGSVYPNIVDSMVSQGAINSKAYSLWLNDPDSADGNVLFGGVDSTKYTGTLISMPVVPDADGSYTTLSMPLSSISFSADGQSFTFTNANFAYPALIDSGTTLMYLPNDIVAAIWKSLSVVVKSQTPLMPCSAINDNTAKMTFGFNGPNGAKIDVLLADLLTPVNYQANNVQYCELLVSGGAPDGLIILGDAFMRSAYLTYDLHNNMIAIAQAKFNVTSSSIQEIGTASIPGASVMSTLVGTLAVTGSATNYNPGAAATAFSTNAGANGVLETTASVPTFKISATGNAASVGATPGPIFSIAGVVAGTVTLLSVCGGAMVMWF